MLGDTVISFTIVIMLLKMKMLIVKLMMAITGITTVAYNNGDTFRVHYLMENTGYESLNSLMVIY